MPTTCQLCCCQEEYFILPPCNHRHICWKCGLKLKDGSLLSCPFCKDTSEGKSTILFVDEELIHSSTFDEVFMKGKVLKSERNSYQFYSSEQVGHFIERQTSNYCQLCQETFSTLNQLKKHLNEVHRRQFCDVCFDSKKCLPSEQHLYTELELNKHLKEGDQGPDGELLLYHPYCEFCKIRFYDLDAFKLHLRTSTHFRCHICEKYYRDRMKYIYYANYEQLERHYEKSHFLCKVGACVGKKFQNVYVSEQALEEHKSKAHKKTNNYKDDGKPVMNVIFGFNRKEQDEEIQWDGIGKNMEKEFTIINQHNEIINQQHIDEAIDIRPFYPEIVKTSQKWSLKGIKEKFFDIFYRIDRRLPQVEFHMVPLFEPLEMGSLTRKQLQIFIRQIFQPKYSAEIIQTFFEKRFNYKSQENFLNDIRNKMNKVTPLSHYYVFPQLVRFMKDENSLKKPMDRFYSSTLHELKVKNEFIIHTFGFYSQLFQFMQDQLKKHLYEIVLEENIDISVYMKYLKDLNINYYDEHHEELFYVSRDRVRNIYHMVSKTKTKELPLLKWLLKVGFSIQAQKFIINQFYYQTAEKCDGKFSKLSKKELALFYLYLEVCLESLNGGPMFENNKINPRPFFLTTALMNMKPCMEKSLYREVQVLENKSLGIHVVAPEDKKKGLILSEELEDHHYPSIIQPIEEKKEQKSITPELGFRSGKVATVGNTNKAKTYNHQENNQHTFPSLYQPKEETKKQKIDEDDFPLLKSSQIDEKTSFQPIKSPKKKNKGKNEKQDLQLFTKNVTRKQWDEEETVKKMDKKKLQETETAKSNKKKNKYTQKEPIKETNEDHFNFQMQIALKESMITYENEHKQSKKIEDDYDNDSEERIIVKKKFTEQELQPKAYEHTQKDQFGRKHKQEITEKKSEKIEKKQAKKKDCIKVRLDISDSEDEEEMKKRKMIEIQEKKKRIEKEHQSMKFAPEDGFQSILDSQEKGGVVNEIINSTKKEAIEPQVRVRKGKKGKREVIIRKGLHEL